MQRMQTTLALILVLTCGAVSAQRLPADEVTREAMRVCETSALTQRFQAPADGCRAAHDAELIARRFEQALHHAVSGCEKYRDHQSCANVASLPRVIANNDQPIAPVFAQEFERLARLICSFGMRVGNGPGLDVNGSLCGYFARQFTLAADHHEWQGLPADAFKRHFNALYEPEIAVLLYRLACEILGHVESCSHAESVNARLEPRNGAKRHARADAVLRDFRQMVVGYQLMELDDAQRGRTVIIQREGGASLAAAP